MFTNPTGNDKVFSMETLKQATRRLGPIPEKWVLVSPNGDLWVEKIDKILQVALQHSGILDAKPFNTED